MTIIIIIILAVFLIDYSLVKCPELRLSSFQNIPPRHQNWRISPELKNRDIYLGLYSQTLFLEGIGLDNGVHVSISSISDP